MNQVVPIPMYEINCQKQCCKTTYCPLQLSYARTIHTFQGSQAGVVKSGDKSNPVDRIIVDVGSKLQESSSPGLLYSGLSRATNLDSFKGANDSAIYFTGGNISIDRILNLGVNGKGETNYYVKLRSKWIELLEKGRMIIPDNAETTSDLHEWFNSNSVTDEELKLFLNRTTWRKQMITVPSYV